MTFTVNTVESLLQFTHGAPQTGHGLLEHFSVNRDDAVGTRHSNNDVLGEVLEQTHLTSVSWSSSACSRARSNFE